MFSILDVSGAKHRMGQYFRGDLTGLSLLRNQTDSEQVIRCLNGCQEKLDLAALEDMDTGMVCLTFNAYRVSFYVEINLNHFQRKHEE